MKDLRFSVALHVLVHLAETGAPQTSARLAGCIGTNAVVVRRTMAGLREAGFVTSARGSGGGWALAQDPRRVSLRDVQQTLGVTLLQGVDLTGPGAGRGGCRIQKAVAGTLDAFAVEAAALLGARLGRISLADLATRVRALPRGRHSHAGEHHA